MQRRIAETFIHLLIGMAALWIGFTRDSSNYALFFFLMAGMFFLAIFRPWKFP